MSRIDRGKLTFEVGDEKIKFLLSKFIKKPCIGYTCCLVDIIDECVREYLSEPLLSDGLKASLTGSIVHEDREVESYKGLPHDMYYQQKKKLFFDMEQH